MSCTTRYAWVLWCTLWLVACGSSDGGGMYARPRTDASSGAGRPPNDGTAGQSEGDAGAAGPACVAVDGDCSDLEVDCCDGATCVTDEDDADYVCAADCATDADCSTGCCAPLLDGWGAVCSPAIYCTDDGGDDWCPDLVLLAEDDTDLGDADSDPQAMYGVCNPDSDYGSDDAPTSIFNAAGDYGSATSSLSAYHPSTSTPPFLYCLTTDETFNPVSKNAMLFDAIDPDELCSVLAESGY